MFSFDLLTFLIAGVKLYTKPGKMTSENTGYNCGFYAIFRCWSCYEKRTP